MKYKVFHRINGLSVEISNKALATVLADYIDIKCKGEVNVIEVIMSYPQKWAIIHLYCENDKYDIKDLEEVVEQFIVDKNIK